MSLSARKTFYSYRRTIVNIVHDERYPDEASLMISGLETTALDNSNNNGVNNTTTSDILPSALMTLHTTPMSMVT